MCGADVGDDAPVGRGDACEGGDFAGVVHAHLDDRNLVLGFEAQQLQGQAKGVVEIADGFEDVEFCAERGGDGFFGGGFAGRAGDGDDALAPLAAHMRGQSLQGDQRVFGDEQRHGESSVGKRGDAGAGDHGGDGSALDCGDDEVVPIEPVTAYGKEQLAGSHGARVDGVAGRHERACIGDAGGRFKHRARADGRLCEGEFHRTSPYPSSARVESAISESSKGMEPLARICSFSWPLPAISTTSLGFAASSARRMAAARSGSMV